MTRPRRRLAAALVLAAMVLAACGGGGSSGPDGDEIGVQVASYDLAVGPASRFLVGVLSADNRFLAYGDVQLRFNFVGDGQTSAERAFGPPVTARYLPLPGTDLPTPAPASPELVAPSQARGVYVSQAGFDRPGFWEVELTTEVAGRQRSAVAAFQVLSEHKVPAVGEPAPRSENRTLSSPPEIPRPAIDSRAATGGIPDPELHQATIAGALAAGRPVVAVFSTPVYCRSQFCGPITDMVAELAADYGNRATFVHVEIYYEFETQTLNAAAAEWLQEGDFTEPWVFVVAADGRITARFDNVATRGELVPLLDRLPVIGA